MKKPYLFAPGPTPIPTNTLLEIAKPIDYHRTVESAELIRSASKKLQHVFQTQNEVLMLTCSGTGALEAAVASLFSTGDRVIVIRSGKFGERWGEICTAYGIDLEPIDLEWGHSIDPQQVADRLKQYPDCKAILSTLCETSTGALHDIQSLGQILKGSETLLVVDAVSALAADNLEMDNWGVDVVVSASHKGLMSPPGLGLVSYSENAWRASEKSNLPKYYFDLRKARKTSREGSTPYTPAITFIIALNQALDQICQEQIQNVLHRHARLANATRNGVKAIGFNLFARSPANTLTSIQLPAEIDGKAFVQMMRNRYSITYAGGQAHLSGKIIRIAHLGWVTEHDVIVAISALERGLAEVGYPVPPGAAVAAAQETFVNKRDIPNIK